MIKKRIVASILSIMAVAVGSIGITASANTVSDSYGSFEWDGTNATYAKTTNLCTSGTRSVGASITVYKDGSGDYVTAYYASNTGGYGTTAKATQSTYKPSSYNFKLYGSVGNAANASAGLATSFTKYVN